MSASGPGAGGFLLCIPNPNFGTSMSSEDFRCAVSLRLGLLPDRGICQVCKRDSLDSNGVAATTCNRSVSRFTKHNEIAKIIADQGQLAGFPAQRERLLLFSNRQRPADVQLSNFNGPRPLAIDVSVTNPLASSYVSRASIAPLSAAKARDETKRTKYSRLCFENGLDFMPFTIETYGALSKIAYSFARVLINRTCALQGDQDPVTIESQFRFLLQRISVTLQSFNASMIRSSSDRSALGVAVAEHSTDDDLPEPPLLPQED